MIGPFKHCPLPAGCYHLSHAWTSPQGSLSQPAECVPSQSAGAVCKFWSIVATAGCVCVWVHMCVWRHVWVAGVKHNKAFCPMQSILISFRAWPLIYTYIHRKLIPCVWGSWNFLIFRRNSKLFETSVSTKRLKFPPTYSYLPSKVLLPPGAWRLVGVGQKGITMVCGLLKVYSS